jgi:DNA ligase-1
MATYIVHKAVEFGNITVKARKLLGVAAVADLADKYDAQFKYDGCFCIVLLTGMGSYRVVSRTGEPVRSMDHVARRLQHLFDPLLKKGHTFAVMGEAWTRGEKQPRISGDFRAHEPRLRLQFAAFDLLPLAEFEAGASEREFADRYRELSTYTRGFNESDTVFLCPLFHAGTYGDPMEFADRKCAEGGFDGLILRDPRGWWKAGLGTTGEIVKAKPRETFDLRITGFKEGEGKYAGTVGKVVLEFKDGTVVEAAGGTDAERAAWWAAPEKFIGLIGEVAAMERLPSGALREPVFKGIRYDKEDSQ